MPHDRHAPQADRDKLQASAVGRFAIEDQLFRIVVVEPGILFKNLINGREVARFSVYGRALAVLEEASQPELDVDTSNMIGRLTGRELQIAAMIARGDATKNVAHKLQISEWTVGSHLRRIFAKLGVDNRAAMVYLCASLIEKSGPEMQQRPKVQQKVRETVSVE